MRFPWLVASDRRSNRGRAQDPHEPKWRWPWPQGTPLAEAGGAAVLRGSTGAVDRRSAPPPLSQRKWEAAEAHFLISIPMILDCTKHGHWPRKLDITSAATSTSSMEHSGRNKNGACDDESDDTDQQRRSVQHCQLQQLCSARWYGTGATWASSHGRACHNGIRHTPCRTQVQRHGDCMWSSNMVFYTSRRWCSSTKATACGLLKLDHTKTAGTV